MRFSKSFTLAELTKSTTALRHGFHEQFKPKRAAVENLSLLCTDILQPVRDFLKSPIRVTSGYRCERLNTQVGGSRTSDHMEGLAADIEGWDESDMIPISLDECPHGHFIKLCDRIDDSTHLVHVNAAILLYIAFNLEGSFDQLISEYGEESNPSWIHVSSPPFNSDKAKGQILRKASGKGYVGLTKMDLFNSIVVR